MRAWWSVLFVPQRRTHLQRSCDCSLLCLEEPTPKSLRKVRRSIVFGCAPDTWRASRCRGASSAVALRVSSISVSSDLGGAVVVVDVLARLIAARGTLVLRGSGLGGRRFARHD